MTGEITPMGADYAAGKTVFSSYMNACDSLLVASEAWYPGWQAYLDGAPAPSYVANHALRSLLLPAGEHTVEWRYQPDSFRIGAGLSALALFLCLVLLIASLRRTGSTAGSGRRYPTRYR